MKNFEMDTLDKAIIAMLSEDGRMPIKEIADTLKVSGPTVRSRLKSLKEREIIVVSALIDSFKVEEVSWVHIGICLEQGLFTQGLDEISGLKQLNWIVAVAGRYDLLAQFTISGGRQGLYSLLNEELNNIKSIKSTESFVATGGLNKRVFVPRDMRVKWLEDYTVQKSASSDVTMTEK